VTLGLTARDQNLETPGAFKRPSWTGLRLLGDVPWGQHVALFYDTKEDLLEICGSFSKLVSRATRYCVG